MSTARLAIIGAIYLALSLFFAGPFDAAKVMECPGFSLEPGVSAPLTAPPSGGRWRLEVDVAAGAPEGLAIAEGPGAARAGLRHGLALWGFDAEPGPPTAVNRSAAPLAVKEYRWKNFSGANSGFPNFYIGFSGAPTYGPLSAAWVACLALLLDFRLLADAEFMAGGGAKAQWAILAAPPGLMLLVGLGLLAAGLHLRMSWQMVAATALPGFLWGLRDLPGRLRRAASGRAWAPDRRRLSVIAGVFVFTLALGLFQAQRHIGPEGGRTSDVYQYLAMAGNMYHHAVCSDDIDHGAYPAPAAFRPPGYPAFLLLGQALFPALGRLTPRELAYNQAMGLKYMQAALLIICALACAYFVLYATGRAAAAFACPLLVLWSPDLWWYANQLYIEHYVAVFIAFLGIACYAYAQRPSLPRALVMALLAGYLALTRAVFLYFLPVLVALAGLYAWRRAGRGGWRRAAAVALLVALAGGAATLPWLDRNRRLFDHAVVASRGGQILYIRSLYVDMNPRQYLASFVFLSSVPYLNPNIGHVDLNDHYRTLGGIDLYHTLFGGLFSRDDMLLFQHWSGHSYWDQGMGTWDDLRHKYGEVASDDMLKHMALEKIKQKPLQFLAATLPFALRGVYIEGYTGDGGWYLGPLLILCLLVLAWVALRRADWPTLWFLLPAGFMYAFHAALTVNDPRFNAPLLIVCYVGAALLAARAWQRWRRRWRPDPAPGR